jgi:hypothetical protein
MSATSGLFPCAHPNCNKSYSTEFNLRRHFESSHCKLKRFRCRVCAKYLSSKQNLQEHSYTHSRAKPYVCKEHNCGKAFRQSSQLSNHKKLHSELLRMLQIQNEFKEIKVIIRQLTALIKPDARGSLQLNAEERNEKIVLPSIKGEQASVTLPELSRLI